MTGRRYIVQAAAKRVCMNARNIEGFIDPVHANRSAPHPGPRCATCWREETARRKTAAHGRHIAANYDITTADYNALYLAQGGTCYVCRRSTGKAKRLAVDHDHHLAAQHDHPPEQACKLCIRGLACGPCNRDVLGRLGGDPRTYEAIRDALLNPPAAAVFHSDGGTPAAFGQQLYLEGE